MTKLGINTSFALNRYPNPEQWLKVAGEDLDLRYVQLTADLINPSLYDCIIDDYVKRINTSRKQYCVEIDSVMTGAFTRVNHFSHPDSKVRKYWRDWFKKLADISVRIGANNLSSHLGILCYEDLYDNKKREYILEETVDAWKELACYGKAIGLKYLSWEPMSIKREYGETLEETYKIQEMFKDSAIPINICLDVSHGNASSGNIDDINYEKWLERFGKKSPLIHIKQVIKGQSSHHPFTSENNSIGQITPKGVLTAMERYDAKDSLLLLELAFREREPTDSLVLEQLKESVKYWKDGIYDYEK